MTYVSLDLVREFYLSQIGLVTDRFVGGCQTFLLCVTRPLRAGSGDETALYIAYNFKVGIFGNYDNALVFLILFPIQLYLFCTHKK